MNFELLTRGFDFLGYWFSPQGLSVAKKTVERMVDKVTRLYEQGAEFVRIESYLTHWWRWVRSGMDGLLASSSLGVLIGDAVGCGRAIRTLPG